MTRARSHRRACQVWRVAVARMVAMASWLRACDRRPGCSLAVRTPADRMRENFTIFPQRSSWGFSSETNGLGNHRVRIRRPSSQRQCPYLHRVMVRSRLIPHRSAAANHTLHTRLKVGIGEASCRPTDRFKSLLPPFLGHSRIIIIINSQDVS